VSRISEKLAVQIVDRDGLKILEYGKELEGLLETEEKGREMVQVARAERKIVEEKRLVHIDNILNQMTPNNMIRVRANYVIAERGQNVNPTVTALDPDTLEDVPPEFIIPRPKLDKRGIQSFIAKTGTVPAGIIAVFKQRLKVTRRHEKTEE